MTFNVFQQKVKTAYSSVWNLIPEADKGFTELSNIYTWACPLYGVQIQYHPMSGLWITSSNYGLDKQFSLKLEEAIPTLNFQA